MRVLTVEDEPTTHKATPPSQSAINASTSTGFWADLAKTGQLEDLVAQLALVGMCAMLIVGLVYWAAARRAQRTGHTALAGEEQRDMRAKYSQRFYRGLEALDLSATTSKGPSAAGAGRGRRRSARWMPTR
jgi:hypothetical protein